MKADQVVSVKKQVSIEYIESLQAQRRWINSLDLEDIEFTKDDKVIHIPLEIIRDFKFTGLNNTDFITSEFYKEGWEDIKWEDMKADQSFDATIHDEDAYDMEVDK